ncbi:hypothetical protein M513_13490 [Trichuris suis]|uniref:Dynactin subunit 6 n=1 Tax=Trichuris suis TaxID=68888 RepID=A0A085LKY5_9BILA|nr:hypothetical protein M513_13490 [Trichuris suis]
MDPVPAESTSDVNHVIMSNVEIQGSVTIGPGTVVQSFAKILALGGPIVIGKDNVIEEFACIVNKRRDATMSIGNRNIFEIGCCTYRFNLFNVLQTILRRRKVRAGSEALKVGNFNVIRARAVVGPDVELTKRCTIGTQITLQTSEILEEGTVVYGSSEKRLMGSTLPRVEELQFRRLQKLLPQYHTLVLHNKSE